MKNRRTLALIMAIFAIGIPFGLSACSSNQEDQVQIDDAPRDRRIGEIRSLGTATGGEGTHVLQLDDGDTLLLRSLAINLDDEKYEDATVEVRGVINYTKQSSRPIMDVESIDILDIEVDDEDESLSWDEYESAAYDFSIRYRSDYEVSQTSDGVMFERPIVFEEELAMESDEEEDVEAESGSIEVPDEIMDIVEIRVNAKGDDTLAAFLGLSDLDSSTLLAGNMTLSKVGAENLDAIKQVGGIEGADMIFYVESETRIFTIMFTAGDQLDSLEGENLFFEMLGSFRADGAVSIESDADAEDAAGDENGEENESGDIDAPIEVPEEEIVLDVDIPSVKGFADFEHDTLGFSIKYPSNWYYTGTVSGGGGVIRHYDFGDKAESESAEEDEDAPIKVDSVIGFDVMTDGAPSGSSVSINGKSVTRVSSGGMVHYYTEESDGRTYHVEGPAAADSTLKEMIGSVSVE